MSGTTLVTIAALGTGTIATSGNYDISLGLVSNLFIEGQTGQPITVTASLASVSALTTTDIGNADEQITGLAGVAVLTTTNLGLGGTGLAVGNGTLELGSALGVGALDSINFYGTGNKLIIDPGVTLSLLSSINNFGAGDQIELKGVVANSATFVPNGNGVGGVVDLYENGSLADSFSLSTGSFTPHEFQVTTDPNGGVDLSVCFLEGTRILGLHGDIAVEDMEPGDRLITDSGAMRPVKWIGRRLIDAKRHPRPETVWPIRIEAGAIDHGLPERTLYVSPDHALYLDGCLIPAKTLVNGRSIVQEPRDRIMYYHVELETHDILLAESLPVESYLDTGNRNFFENGNGAMVLYPHMAQTLREATGCAPFAEDGAVVEAVRTRLLERLPKRRGTHDCRLRAMTDQGEATVTVIDQLTYRIDLPETGGDLLLLSHAMVPAESDVTSRDRRRLGLDVAALEVETTTGSRQIALDDDGLRTGWHAFETMHRWTNGEASIPADMLADGHALIVKLHALATYYADASAGRDAARVADLIMARQVTAMRRMGLLG